MLHFFFLSFSFKSLVSYSCIGFFLHLSLGASFFSLVTYVGVFLENGFIFYIFFGRGTIISRAGPELNSVCLHFYPFIL